MCDGRQRVRCRRGWLSVTGTDVDSVFLVSAAGQPRVCFGRGGARYWVSVATPDGRPLLMSKDGAASGQGDGDGAARGRWRGRRPQGGAMARGGLHGTRGERVAAHIREKEEHTSEEGVAIVNQYLAECDQRLWRPALMYVAAAKAWELGFVGASALPD